MPEVSVVIPLFGTHRGRDTVPAVARAWLAQDVRCEVLIATAGAIPIATDPAVRIIRADESMAAPGALRNVGAARASAPLLYLSDADVLPLGRDFVGRAIELGGGAAVAQPWMYRLPAGVVGPDSLALEAPREPEVCYVTAAPDGSLRPIGGERFTWDGADAMVIPPPEIAGEESAELVWRPPFHWGGLLIDREVFTDIGGYCERYRGWGCEDDDLLVKAAAGGPLVRAWRADPSLACLHFEHPRPYDTAEFVDNQRTLAERITAGAAAMIHADGSKRERQ